MEPVAVLRLALRVLSDRAIVVGGLAMACFLSAWVMYDPSWHRVAALGIFSLLTLLVVPSKEKKREVDKEAE